MLLQDVLFKWFINEIAGLSLALWILSGILDRLSSEELAKSFVNGAKDMINAALIIGCARAILLLWVIFGLLCLIPPVLMRWGPA